MPAHASSTAQTQLSAPICFLLLSASCFLIAWQNHSLKTLYPLFLVCSAADGCYSSKPACDAELHSKTAFLHWAIAPAKEISRKEIEIGSNEKLWRTQECFSHNRAPSLSYLIKCISEFKKIKIPSMPLCLHLSPYRSPSKSWLCAKDTCFHESRGDSF